MPRLNELSPDLRATLSLLVDRGKSYAEVAALLGMPESAVRARAHAALDALAGAENGVGVPAARSPGATQGQPTGRATIGSPQGLPVSRRGGALLLAGIAAVVVVAVILLTSGGGSSSGSHPSASASAGGRSGASSPSSSTSAPNGAKTPTVTKQLTLTSPDPSSKAIGIVEVLAEGSQHAFYLAAEHLPPTRGFFYAVWLYNSPTSAQAISKSPPVKANGRLQGGALLPSNAGEYHKIVLTRETSERPTHPGPTVLSGAFSVG